MEKKDFKYTLGLDIGIASVGWAVIDNEGKKIIKSGVRCFNRAENPKTGESLALPRRLKRSVRRIIRRRHQRLCRIVKLLRESGLDFEKKDFIYFDPWKLRCDALKRKLKEEEFACILLHIAKRRGFKSAKKIKKVDINNDSIEKDNKSDERSKMLSGVSGLKAELEKSGCETIGEYLASLSKKRNEPESYKRTVLRELLEDEVKKIFEIQFKVGCAFASNVLLKKYLEIAFTQRPIQSTKDMVGFCEFEKNEKRASKATFTFEKFRNLQFIINNIKISKLPRLESEDIKRIINLALNDKSGKVTYKKIRKELELRDDEKFLNLKYGRNEDGKKEKDPESEVAIEFKAYAKLRKAIETIDADFWNELKSNIDLYDEIAQILTVEKDERKIKDLLTNKIKDKCQNYEDVVDNLLDCTFATHGNLSLKAMRKIIPFLEEGLTYDKACLNAGYKHSETTIGYGNKKFLPKFENLRNPVVNRSLSQVRKVVNALIREYGSFKDIYIELARDMGKTFKERREIEKRNEKSFETAKERKGNFIDIFKREPLPGEIERFRLWQEQSHVCPYCSKNISPHEMENGTLSQVDHIVPFSRSFDDSLNNKVLVCSKCNQEKGNKTPYEWFGKDIEKWNRLLETTSSYNIYKKRNLYIGQNDNSIELEEKLDNFKNRNLNDTRYITREVMKAIKNSLRFEDNKQHVFCRNGHATDLFKKFWGVSYLKNRDENDRHHALDAIVVALCSNSANQKLSTFFTHHEYANNLIQHSNVKERFELPWETFRYDVEESIENIFVSRMPIRKITGEAHEETIRSQRVLKDGSKIILQRIKIKDVTSDNIEKLYEKSRNKKLYDTIKNRLEEFKSEPKKAFLEPIYMPKNDGTQGPQIKSITITTTEKSGLYLNKNENASRRPIASNGSMVRVDIFEKDGKFYGVPIYVADMVKKELPNRACVAYKDESEWILMDSTYNFKFSLYPYDYINLINSKGETTEGYYKSFHRGTAGISEIISHDNSKSFSSGIKNLKNFEKYTVDVLGNKYKVKSEKRNGLEKRHNNKSCKSKIKGQATSSC